MRAVHVAYPRLRVSALPGVKAPVAVKTGPVLTLLALPGKRGYLVFAPCLLLLPFPHLCSSGPGGGAEPFPVPVSGGLHACQNLQGKHSFGLG